MFINLQQLEQRPLRFHLDLPAGDIEYDVKISQSGPLHAEGSVQLLNHSVGDIRVQGVLKVVTSATCDRCLETATFPIEKSFDLVYLPDGESASGEVEIDQAAIEVGYYTGNGLSLNDVFREVVLLALPMQLVCSEACKGICPVCGQNRNNLACGCQSVALDDRWGQLKQLRTGLTTQN